MNESELERKEKVLARQSVVSHKDDDKGLTNWEIETQEENPATKSEPVFVRDPSTYAQQAYAQQALSDACDNVFFEDEGERNHTLNSEAFQVATLCGGGYLDENEARSELTEAALSAGLEEEEIQNTLNSAFKAGLKKPRELEKISLPF